MHSEDLEADWLLMEVFSQEVVSFSQSSLTLIHVRLTSCPYWNELDCFENEKNDACRYAADS